MVNATCACGAPVWILKTGECKRCYHRRYARERRPRPQPGAPHPRPLAGTTPALATPCTYLAAHYRVRNARGKASEHDCIECGDRAAEWSYRGGSPHEISGSRPKQQRGNDYAMRSTWSPYVWDYDPLCVTCHRRRDAETEEIAA